MSRLVHISRSVLLVAATVGLSAIQEAQAATISDPFVELYNVSPEFNRASCWAVHTVWVLWGIVGWHGDARGGTATTTNLFNGNSVARTMFFRPSPVSPKLCSRHVRYLTRKYTGRQYLCSRHARQRCVSWTLEFSI